MRRLAILISCLVGGCAPDTADDVDTAVDTASATPSIELTAPTPADSASPDYFKVAINEQDGGAAWTRAIAFRPPGGRVAATASDDGVVRLWSGTWDQPDRTFKGGPGNLTDLVFVDDGERIIASAFGGSTRLWDIESGDSLAAFGDATVRGLAPVPGTSLVLWIGHMSGLSLWNAATMTDEGIIGIGSWLHGLAVSPDGDVAAVVSREGYVRVWRIEPRGQLWTYRHPHIARAVAFSADGMRIYAGGSGNIVSVLDRETGELIRTWDVGALSQLAVDRSDRFVATAGNQVIRLWDARSLAQVATIDREVGRQVEDLSFSEDGSRLGSVDREGAVVWNVSTVVESFPPKPIPHYASSVGRNLQCGEGEAGLRFGGVVIDSLTGLPIDSAYIQVGRCTLLTDESGHFELAGVRAYDSIQFSASRTGYRTVDPWLPPESDSELSVVLPPRLRCEGSRATGLPRVETVDSAVVLRLTPAMQASLDRAAPRFVPQPLNEFVYYNERSYDYACYQAPSAVIGDFNGDGSDDLLTHGRSDGQELGVMLISSPDGYSALTRGGLVPYSQHLSRVGPATYSGLVDDEPPLTLMTDGVLQTGEMYAYRIVYYLDGEIRTWDYPFL